MGVPVNPNLVNAPGIFSIKDIYYTKAFNSWPIAGYDQVVLVGGGGGGGTGEGPFSNGIYYYGNFNTGAGGGGGGQVNVSLIKILPGASYNYTIGYGGPGAVKNYNPPTGLVGGNTTFGLNFGAYSFTVLAYGGGGGGPPGNIANGNFSLGSQGGAGDRKSVNLYPIYYPQYITPPLSYTSLVYSGNGGSAYIPIPPSLSSNPLSGSAGGGGGAGGSGFSSGPGLTAGNNGGPGIGIPIAGKIIFLGGGGAGSGGPPAISAANIKQGGTFQVNDALPGYGGIGGGGNSGGLYPANSPYPLSAVINGQPGLPGTGGGGGGAWNTALSASVGGNGGTGIIYLTTTTPISGALSGNTGLMPISTFGNAFVYGLSSSGSITFLATNASNQLELSGTGFTKSVSGNNVEFVFNSSGTFSIPLSTRPELCIVNLLCVAGGGGGGTGTISNVHYTGQGGGGGGGGVTSYTVYLTSGIKYQVIVGAGGSGASGPQSGGYTGGITALSSVNTNFQIVAYGGGGNGAGGGGGGGYSGGVPPPTNFVDTTYGFLAYVNGQNAGNGGYGVQISTGVNIHNYCGGGGASTATNLNNVSQTIPYGYGDSNNGGGDGSYAANVYGNNGASNTGGGGGGGYGDNTHSVGGNGGSGQFILYTNIYKTKPTQIYVGLAGGGGGGGGGSTGYVQAGGGGGGGQFAYVTTSIAPFKNYTVTVGAGGAGGAIDQYDGNGGDSSGFGPFVAYGGNGGGGGSGNGGSVVYGNSGGSSYDQNGGGGGGAGNVGYNSGNINGQDYAGNGGSGVYFLNIGCCQGGGGGYGQNATYGGNGGDNGGNYGYGGNGGGCAQYASSGSNGGGGYVIIAYPNCFSYPSKLVGASDISDSNLYIFLFTSSGSISW